MTIFGGISKGFGSVSGGGGTSNPSVDLAVAVAKGVIEILDRYSEYQMAKSQRALDQAASFSRVRAPLNTQNSDSDFINNQKQ
ncbi:MAG: hypothetical protein PHV68_02545 [Candidatus Gastranaerophilales bacterium]|nr:hypothetical protein [Candidatus Gastranaerophilales bacterium]